MCSIPLCLARRSYVILEKSNIRKLQLNESKTLVISEKYPKEIITLEVKKKSIFSLEVLCFEKANKNKQDLFVIFYL